ncbi:hypothetical protein [Alicyclobacillus shizuokensis]|uniref:hypothetical protein n=1 Tax=Alicyclobacillus shizuokensis TaxID=392014 RepID=UPI000A932A18|nr:hypothetical protein [Alicyclobacillus shizuokensis]
MQSLLTPLLGTRIHIEQHNDTGLTGWLVNIQPDYASVFTDDGRIVHYPFGHIKSVTTNITELPQQVNVPQIAFPESFRDVLAALWMQLVRVELGEGARQGVLVQIEDDAICLVLSSKELIYYPVFQIVNLSPVFQLKGIADAPEPSAGAREGSSTQSTVATGDVARAEASAASESNQLKLFRRDSQRSRRRRLAAAAGNDEGIARRTSTTGGVSNRRAPRMHSTSPNRSRPSWVHPSLRV